MGELGRRARELLQELKSYDRLTLPPFNEDLVRLVFSEINEHDDQTRAIVQEQRRLQQEQEAAGEEVVVDPMVPATIMAHHECIKRSKRLLLIYMRERMERLKAIRWNSRGLPRTQADRACPSELQFYKEYDRLLGVYMRRGEGVGMDLTLDTCPPKDTLVLLRGIKDVGEVVVSYGAVTIHKSCTLSLPLEDAEPLLKDGAVERLHWDDVGRYA